MRSAAARGPARRPLEALAGADRTRTSHAVDVLEQAAAGLDGPVTALADVADGATARRRPGGRGGGIPGPGPARGRGGGQVRTAPARMTSTTVPVAFSTKETEAALAPFRTPLLRRRALTGADGDQPFGRFLPGGAKSA